MPTPSLDLPTDSLTIRAWSDPVIDQVGHDPRSRYVERFWLGILGPSTTWLIRYLVTELEAKPDGFVLSLATCARTLGLGDKAGRHSPFARAILRSCQFGMARAEGETELAVRRKVPPLTRRQAAALPEPLCAAHAEWLEAELAVPRAQREQQRARQLALSLLDLGEDPETTERTLVGWRFAPALAHHAVGWGLARRQRALAAAGRPGAGGAEGPPADDTPTNLRLLRPTPPGAGPPDPDPPRLVS